jgi:hypothetical protein
MPTLYMPLQRQAAGADATTNGNGGGCFLVHLALALRLNCDLAHAKIIACAF